jgi:hypothetical protein
MSGYWLFLIVPATYLLGYITAALLGAAKRRG